MFLGAEPKVSRHETDSFITWNWEFHLMKPVVSSAETLGFLRRNFHSVPDFHQRLDYVPFLGRESLLHLAQAVAYQLPGFDVAVAYDVRVVDHIDVLQTRKFGCRIYVDVEVSADDDLTLLEAHTIAENIHKAIESNFSEVKHCMVHVNPCSEVHHD